MQLLSLTDFKKILRVQSSLSPSIGILFVVYERDRLIDDRADGEVCVGMTLARV